MALNHTKVNYTVLYCKIILYKNTANNKLLKLNSFWAIILVLYNSLHCTLHLYNTAKLCFMMLYYTIDSILNNVALYNTKIQYNTIDTTALGLSQLGIVCWQLTVKQIIAIIYLIEFFFLESYIFIIIKVTIK